MKNKNKSADFKHSVPLLHIMLTKGFSKHFRTDPSKYPKSVYPRHLQGVWLLHFHKLRHVKKQRHDQRYTEILHSLSRTLSNFVCRNRVESLNV